MLRKERWDNIHIIISRVFLHLGGPKKNFLPFVFFLLDNDSDTEIKGKVNFFPHTTTLKQLTHTHACLPFIERFTNIGKKYEIIKILDVWYWFLLIFHYESKRGREGSRWAKSSGGIFPIFFASAYIFLLPYKNRGERQWSEKYFNFSLFVTWTHNGKHITSMREERKKNS